MATLENRVELLLQLLSVVISHVRLEVEQLLPLVRLVLQTLTVDGLQLLQVKAVGKCRAGWQTLYTCSLHDLALLYLL